MSRGVEVAPRLLHRAWTEIVRTTMSMDCLRSPSARGSVGRDYTQPRNPLAPTDPLA